MSTGLKLLQEHVPGNVPLIPVNPHVGSPTHAELPLQPVLASKSIQYPSITIVLKSGNDGPQRSALFSVAQDRKVTPEGAEKATEE
jgi:hypothetical protein